MKWKSYVPKWKDRAEKLISDIVGLLDKSVCALASEVCFDDTLRNKLQDFLLKEDLQGVDRAAREELNKVGFFSLRLCPLPMS